MEKDFCRKILYIVKEHCDMTFDISWIYQVLSLFFQNVVFCYKSVVRI